MTDRPRSVAHARRLLASAACFLLAFPGAPVEGQTDALVTLDSATTHQTITGWEAVAWASNDSPAFEEFIGQVLERAVREVGLTRVRLEVRAGAENDRDYWAEYRAGEIEYATWRCNRYATVNDNGDPYAINPDGFHFSELDWTVEHIVLPLMRVAEAEGETLYVNVNYVAFTGQIQCGGQYLHDNPDEYAEFVLATYLHLQERYGLVPDAWEVLLEPDNVSQWNGGTIGDAIVAAAVRLEAAGFTPRFIAPSTTNMGNASTYFDAMIARAPECLSHITELCYHRYGGVSASNLQKIADRAVAHDLDTSMLEWWSSGNTFRTLHEDLKQGRNSAWQRGVLAGAGDPDGSAKLFAVDTSNPADPTVRMNHGTKYLRQYFRFVRPGSVRIEAGTTSSAFDPLAFVHPTDGTVVVLRADRGGSISIAQLPPGTYGINYTTGSPNNAPSAYDIDRPDVHVGAGDTLETSIPAAGVMTIYAKTPPPTEFLRGDCNDDGWVDVTDPVGLLFAIFLGEIEIGCDDACDANDDGFVDISDAITSLRFLFLREGTIPPPGMQDCGIDPSGDVLGCELYQRCR